MDTDTRAPNPDNRPYPDSKLYANTRLNWYIYEDAIHDGYCPPERHSHSLGNTDTVAHLHLRTAAGSDSHVLASGQVQRGRRKNWKGAPEIEMIIIDTAVAVIALCIGIAIGLSV